MTTNAQASQQRVDQTESQSQGNLNQSQEQRGLRSRSGFGNFLKQFDLLGQSIDMNYRGNYTFQTHIGAILSIFIMITVGAYSTLKLMQMIHHDQPDFIVNNVLKNMYEDFPEPINGTISNFEFAVGYLQIRPYKYVEPDPRIGEINMRRVDMDQRGAEIIFQKYPSRIGNCDPEVNFTKDTSINAFKQNMTKFICLDSDDSSFQGTLISPVHQYMHFEILACNQTALSLMPGHENDTCADKEEVQQFFDFHVLVGYVTNTYVDKSHFGSNPIKTINDVIFYEQLNFRDHIRKEVHLNYNEVELKDSYFLIWDEHQTEAANFLSVDHSVSQSLRTINPTAYFQCDFRLSNKVVEYERVIYSFFDMLGDIGGFGEAVYIFCWLCVGGYAHRMFLASVMQDIFRVRLSTGGTQIKELYRAKTNKKQRASSDKRKTADEVLIQQFSQRQSQLHVEGKREESSDPVTLNHDTVPKPTESNLVQKVEQTTVDKIQTSQLRLTTGSPDMTLIDHEGNETTPINNALIKFRADTTADELKEGGQKEEVKATPKTAKEKRVDWQKRFTLSLPQINRLSDSSSVKAPSQNSKRFDAASMQTLPINRSLIETKVSPEQLELEHNLSTQRSYKLSHVDVSSILLGQNIQKYKRFIFSGYQAIAGKFWSCLFRTLPRKKQKFVLLYKDGESRIGQALDVRKIIETTQNVQLLKNLLFRKQSRVLFRLQRENLLEFGGSESERSSICSSDISALRNQTSKRKNFIESLDGWKVKTSLEKKLVLGVLHRRGHKNFEEREDNSDDLISQNQHDLFSHSSQSHLQHFRDKKMVPNLGALDDKRTLHKRVQSLKQLENLKENSLEESKQSEDCSQDSRQFDPYQDGQLREQVHKRNKNQFASIRNPRPRSSRITPYAQKGQSDMLTLEIGLKDEMAVIQKEVAIKANHGMFKNKIAPQIIIDKQSNASSSPRKNTRERVHPLKSTAEPADLVQTPTQSAHRNLATPVKGGLVKVAHRPNNSRNDALHSERIAEKKAKLEFNTLNAEGYGQLSSQRDGQMSAMIKVKSEETVYQNQVKPDEAGAQIKNTSTVPMKEYQEYLKGAIVGGKAEVSSDSEIDQIINSIEQQNELNPAKLERRGTLEDVQISGAEARKSLPTIKVNQYDSIGASSLEKTVKKIEEQLR